MCNICEIPKRVVHPYSPPNLGGAGVVAESVRGFKGILDVIQRVYTGTLLSKIDLNLWKFTAETLYKGVEKGYGKRLIDLDYETPDAEMLRGLRNNVYVFSAFKTHQELRQMTDLLTTEDGKPKSKAKFVSEALALHKDMDVRFLNVEYDHAIKSAQSIAQWQRIQNDKKVLPFLTIKTVGDKRVRHEHAILNNLRLPVDHPFWRTRFPPFDWGCRCDVIQEDRGEITPNGKIPHLELKPMFRTNVGITGVVFPEKHPYYKVSQKEKATLTEYLKGNLPAVYKGKDLKIEKFKTDKGNVYEVANTHIGDERAKNIAISKILVDKGHRVILLHNGIEDKKVYDLAMPKGSKYPKHADALIDGEIWEFKTNETGRWKTLKREISEGHHQADNVLVRFEHAISDEDLERHVKGAMLSTENLKNVWVLKNGEIRKFDRNAYKKLRHD